MGTANLGPDAYRYVAVYRQDEIRAVLPVCVFHRLPLDDIVGDEGRRMPRPLTHRNALPRAVLRRFLPVALNQSGHAAGHRGASITRTAAVSS